MAKIDNNNESAASKSTSTDTKTKQTCTSSMSLKERRKLNQRFRCTPWYNHDEFNHVGYSLSLATQLFSSSSSSSSPSLSSSQQQPSYSTEGIQPNIEEKHHSSYYHDEISHGIERVSIWRKRNVNSSRRLPHYIEITSSLAQSLLQDALFSVNHYHSARPCPSTSTSSSCATMTLRLSYATAIIRGVNGIADSMTRNRAMQITENNNNNNNNQSLSVSNQCLKMGLPSWIVDIRHDASHQELPSLTMLRLGALTLLQFYIDKYWTVNSYSLSSKSIVWREMGLDYLMQWKKSLGGNFTSSGITTCANDNNDDNGLNAGSSDNNGNDDEEEEAGDDDNNITSYGRYSIFMELNKKDKKKTSKKDKQDGKKDDNKKKKTSSKNASSSQHQELLQRTEKTNQDLTIQLMTNFINEIPMDVAYDLLISYFIWGGVGDAPTGRGIFIPGSIKSFPQNIDGIRKLRQKYGQSSLVHICRVWPGFISSMVINLVDAIIMLESSSMDFDDNIYEVKKGMQEGSDCEGDKYDDDEQEQDDDGDISLSNTDTITTAAGARRKVFFLFSWIQYLVSNEFYYHLDWIDKSTKDLIEMKKKTKRRKNNNNYTPWSDEQLAILESTVSFHVLSNVNIPLNSLCDRCEELTHNELKISGEIVSLFRSILRYDESIIDNDSIEVKKRKSLRRDNCEPKKQKQQKARNKIEQEEARNETMFSLEDMESMVMMPDVQPNYHGRGEVEQQEKTSTIVPWTRCTTWDACALGSLPGYIS